MYQERLLTRYRPPPSKRVLLVVPCSKTKPYRNSRSHRRFCSAIDDLRGVAGIHIVSVTSPLGAVPRELEDVPPARDYDIPVTGDWTKASGAEYARLSSACCSRELTSASSSTSTPTRTPSSGPAFPESLHPEWTMTDHRLTVPAALAALHEAASAALEGARPVRVGALAIVREELEAIAAFQFGAEAAARLFAPPVRLHGRPWFQRITDPNGTDLAT